MNNTRLSLLAFIALAGLCAGPQASLAKVTPPDAVAAPAAPPAAAPAPPAAAAKADQPHTLKIEVRASTDQQGDDADSAGQGDTGSHRRAENALVSIGHDSNLAAGRHASAVVSVLGSSTSAGDVDDAVVSVLGNTRVTGPVGDSAVAVMGNTYVDSHVGDSVVAVMGNVELGPHAEVGGDVVAVGGELIRDPGAIVHGQVQNVMLFGKMGNFDGLRSWVQHCLMYGRPLAFAPGLGWAWTLAFGFLGLYLLIALVFPQPVVRCARTMEDRPGRSALTALFTFVAKPIVFLLLLVTVIGMILIPFLAFALFIAGLFGKVVAFAWLGRRVLPARQDGSEFPPVLAVLVGGLIALLLYVVPVLGFIAYKAFDVLGLGIVVYTLILGMQAARAARRPPPAAGGATAAAAGAAAAGVETAGGEAGTAARPADSATGDAASGAAADAAAAAGAGTATAVPAAPALSVDLANRAGFWIRMAALLLDVILIGILYGLLDLHRSHGFLLMLAAYGAILWKLKGSTIGGIVCGLRVARLDGRPIDWPTAVARALGCFLSLIVVGLGFLWIVFDRERQSWHDKIAGTVVVHVPRGTPLV